MYLKNVMSIQPTSAMPVSAISLDNTLVDYGELLDENTAQPSGWAYS